MPGSSPQAAALTVRRLAVAIQNAFHDDWPVDVHRCWPLLSAKVPAGWIAGQQLHVRDAGVCKRIPQVRRARDGPAAAAGLAAVGKRWGGRAW